MGRKRAHGEGTISMRKDGRWEARVSIGYKPDGTPNRKTLYGRTQAEVVEKLSKARQDIGTGNFSLTRLTITEHMEEWLEAKAGVVKASTLAEYERCVKLFIVPKLGGVKLDKLTPMQAQRFITEVRNTSGAARAAKCRGVLFSAYKQAVRFQIVNRNPVEATDPVKEEQREMRIWEADEARRFLDAASAHRMYAFFYLSIATGLRRGELIGLRWSDITGNVLHVRQALVKVKNEFVLSTPKTRKGFRSLAIAPDVLEVMLLHRQRQDEERNRAGAAWPTMLKVQQQKGNRLEPVEVANDFVFTSEVGTMLNPDNLKRLRDLLIDRAKNAWIEEAEKSGDTKTVALLNAGKLMHHVRLHDLRHLHASIAIRDGMDAKLLAERLGHSRASFTLDRYTHLFDSQRAQGVVSLVTWLNSTDSKIS